MGFKGCKSNGFDEIEKRDSRLYEKNIPGCFYYFKKCTKVKGQFLT